MKAFSYKRDLSLGDLLGVYFILRDIKAINDESFIQIVESCANQRIGKEEVEKAIFKIEAYEYEGNMVIDWSISTPDSQFDSCEISGPLRHEIVEYLHLSDFFDEQGLPWSIALVLKLGYKWRYN